MGPGLDHVPCRNSLGRSNDSRGQNFADDASCFHFVPTVDGSDFAGQAFECGFIKLAFRIALFALIVRAVQISYNFCDRDQVARIDLLLVFLRAA